MGIIYKNGIPYGNQRALDATLTQQGEDADAKAVGDAVSELRNTLTQDVPLAGLGAFVNERWTGTAWSSNNSTASNKVPLYLPFDVYIRPNTGYRIKVLTWTSEGVYIGGNESWKTTQQKAVAGSYITLSLTNTAGSGSVPASGAYTYFHASLFEEDINELKAKVQYLYGSVPAGITDADDISMNSIYFVGSSGGVVAIDHVPFRGFLQTFIQLQSRFQVMFPYDSTNNPQFRIRLNDGTWTGWEIVGRWPETDPTEDSLRVYKIFCFGDSITAGSGGTIPYHYYESLYGHHECHNYGIGRTGYLATTTQTDYRGTGQVGRGELLANSGDNTVLDYFKANESALDTSTAITIAAGTNDFNGGWGMDPDASTAEEKKASVLSAFETAIRSTYTYILENHTNPLIVCTPCKRETMVKTYGATLEDYVNIIKSVCAEMGIPVIDFYNDIGLHPDKSAWKEMYIPDGLHPNNLGAQMMGAYFGTKLDEYLDRHR